MWGIEGEGAANYLRVLYIVILSAWAASRLHNSANSTDLGNVTMIANDIEGVAIGTQLTRFGFRVGDNSHSHNLTRGGRD